MTKPSIIQLIVLFILWYVFNAACNVYLLKVKMFPFPAVISAIQLSVGLVYILPLWILGIRKPPKLAVGDLITLFPIAAVNAFGNAITIAAILQKGGGSFAHVIKASEPVVSALLALIMNGIIPKPLSALSLLPVSYGVAYASTLGNLSMEVMTRELFSSTAIMAMLGNIATALRANLRKNLSSDFKLRTNFTAENDNAVIMLFSCLLTLPYIFFLDDIPGMFSTYQQLSHPTVFLQNAFLMGLTFALYNEMQNIVLGSLGPVPTAVGNTLKRVVIFVALFFFTEGETFPMPKIVGCAIAIVGCLLYAIFDSQLL